METHCRNCEPLARDRHRAGNISDATEKNHDHYSAEGRPLKHKGREPIGNLLKIGEVLQITGMSRSSLYNRIREREFVRGVKIGPRSVRFPEAEVRAWIEARISQRDAKGCV